MITHEICRFCGKCCTGEISGRARCEFLGSEGCTLPEEERNKVCNIYPFVIVEDLRRDLNQRRIFLDTGCPYWMAFVDLYKEVRDDDAVSLQIVGKQVDIF